jgi:UDP-glucose 4-epimerase
MRVAVTGASGYVGRALVRGLVQGGHDVAALHHRSPAADVEPRSRIVRGDVRDPAVLRDLIADADAIAHAAAYVHKAADTPRSRAECFAVNEGATRSLVEAAAATSRKPHLVLISTTAVYGGTFRDASEQTSPDPVTPYGESKLAAERIVLDAARAGTITACVLRPTVVYGAGAPGNTRRLVDLLRRGRPVPRVREGMNRKSMVHLDDLTDAIVRALERGDTNSRTFNVGADPVTVAELIDAIAEGLGTKPRWVTVPGWLLDAAAHGSRAASKATAGAFPDLSRTAEAFAGDATVDATAITRDLGVGFRPTLPAVRDMARAMAGSSGSSDPIGPSASPPSGRPHS